METLRKLKAWVGYGWAVLCILVVLATFVGLNSWQKILANGTGLHVSPRFSGGEVRRVVDHGAYSTSIHRVVFDGLLRERDEGFVQIDWLPREKEPLPQKIEEEFDVNGDGSPEFLVRLDSVGGSVQISPKASWVLGPEPLITSGSERILRVRLRNPR